QRAHEVLWVHLGQAVGAKFRIQLFFDLALALMGLLVKSDVQGFAYLGAVEPAKFVQVGVVGPVGCFGHAETSLRCQRVTLRMMRKHRRIRSKALATTRSRSSWVTR